jgi:hypothetical protein
MGINSRFSKEEIILFQGDSGANPVVVIVPLTSGVRTSCIPLITIDHMVSFSYSPLQKMNMTNTIGGLT